MAKPLEEPLGERLPLAGSEGLFLFSSRSSGRKPRRGPVLLEPSLQVLCGFWIGRAPSSLHFGCEGGDDFSAQEQVTCSFTLSEKLIAKDSIPILHVTSGYPKRGRLRGGHPKKMG